MLGFGTSHNLTANLLSQFASLWSLIQDINLDLSDDRSGKIVWTRTASGEYSTKSSYKSVGAIPLQVFLVASCPGPGVDSGPASATPMA
jgi:hypothetical protein